MVSPHSLLASFVHYMRVACIRSEEVLGKALRRVPRHTYYIGTKVFITTTTTIVIITTIIVVLLLLARAKDIPSYQRQVYKITQPLLNSLN